ncbi:MAG: hypothetical protein HC872_09315 [Gammaproteobacteria bacterium]|nr:hypothetical protein [Gammaproteobacteria bacterium]
MATVPMPPIQFQRLERFGQIIICAGRKPKLFIFEADLFRQHQDRRLHTFFAQDAAQFPAVNAGHDDIENHRLEGCRQCAIKPLYAINRFADFIAFVAQIRREQLAASMAMRHDRKLDRKLRPVGAEGCQVHGDGVRS